MCGISGIWYFNQAKNVDELVLRAITDQLNHRGPDEAGCFQDGPVGLGFRRLSVINPKGSSQPVSNEDNRIWLVCNGEIYNYRDLRTRLSNRHNFRTEGDAETILHLYEDYGTRCVDHLRGMFAFGLWDSRAEQITLATDRFGKKPLYYLLDREKIVFASELKALLQVPTIRREFDYEALDEYLSCGYISAPRSIFKGIRKLCPGQIMVVQSDGSARLETYWQPSFAERNQWDSRSKSDLAAELHHRLTEAVRLRLASDVPIGAFLSGGLDSTIVVALMTQLMNKPVKTFSIGFEDDRYDESRHAGSSADYYGTEHYCEIVQATDALDLLPKLVKHYDEPFADSSMIPTYRVSCLARQHVTVALSGDGGDEVFAGYHQHLYAYRQQYLRSMIPVSLYEPATYVARTIPLLAKIRPYITNKPAQNWLSNGFFSAYERRQLYRAETRQLLGNYEGEQVKRDAFQRVAHLDGVSQLQYHDLSVYLPADILVKLDRASMMASLEVRSPLLDHTIFEFMAKVPVRHRLGLSAGKALLKHALGAQLPSFIQERKKQGFSIPQAEWLRDKLDPLLNDMSHITNLFEVTYIQRLIAEHRSGYFDHKDRLWALLCLELWMDSQMRPA